MFVGSCLVSVVSCQHAHTKCPSVLSLIKCSLFLSVTHDDGSSSSALPTSNHLHIHGPIVSLTVVRQISFHTSVNISSSRTIAQKEHFYIHNVSAANLLPSQFEQVFQDGRVPDSVWTALLDKSATPVEAIDRHEGNELDEEGLGKVIKHAERFFFFHCFSEPLLQINFLSLDKMLQCNYMKDDCVYVRSRIERLFVHVTVSHRRSVTFNHNQSHSATEVQSRAITLSHIFSFRFCKQLTPQPTTVSHLLTLVDFS